MESYLADHPEDAARWDVQTGDLLKVTTEIGHFVDRVWVTESIRPGVLACSHHLGRWRLAEQTGGERWSTALVTLENPRAGEWRLRHVHGVRPFESADPARARAAWAALQGKTVKQAQAASVELLRADGALVGACTRPGAARSASGPAAGSSKGICRALPTAISPSLARVWSRIVRRARLTRCAHTPAFFIG